MVTVVMPTFNRLGYLKQTLSTYLSQPAVDEVVVVDDCSTDGTDSWVRQLGTQDSRVRLVRHDHKRGAPGARNSGVAAATGDWILFGEDDVILSQNYVRDLLAEAERSGGDILAGPRIYLRKGETVDEAHRRWEAIPLGHRWFRPFVLEYSFAPSVAETLATPFLQASALIRATVFERCRYDEEYKGNGYREETAFYLSAEEAGFRLFYYPKAFCYHLFVNRQGDGGQWSMSRWNYERWAVRNNWRFLQLHYRHLKNAHGYIVPKWFLQGAFIGDRLIRFSRGLLSAWRRSIWPA